MSIERVNAGDRLSIRAADWNELARTADFVEGLRNRTGGAGSGRQSLDPSKAYGYNSTGEALSIGNIVSVSDLAIDLVDGEWPVFDLGFPDDARLGIMLESVPATGDYAGLVCVAGVARTKVNVTDAGHQFAQPNGTLTALDSSESGPIRILWVAGEGDDQDALVRIEGAYQDGFPDILRIVTNVCDLGGTESLVIPATEDVLVDSEAGINTVEGTYKAKRGTTKIKAVVTWKDPDYESSSGDSFSFKLYVDSAVLTGAPVYTIVTIGGSAEVEKSMEWTVSFEKDKEVTLLLLCYRVSGYRSLMAASGTTRIEIEGLPAGVRTEYRQVTMPSGMVIGPKVCIDRPKDCCVDDQSSDTSSRDTASRSPFPMVWSWPDSPTCIDLMGWRGLEVHGIFGLGEVNVARRFKVRLPTFEPYAFTAYGTNYSACDPRIAEYLTNREIIIETSSTLGGDAIGPDLGQSWSLNEAGFYTYYNPEGHEGCTGGGCGYGLDVLGPEYESYLGPLGYSYPFATGYTYVLSATWGYGLISGSTVVVPRRPVFVVKSLPGLTLRAAASDFLQTFFFDEPITLPVVNELNFTYINPALRFNPDSPYYGHTASGIRATGFVVLEPY